MKAQEHLRQQLKSVTDRLCALQDDLAAARVETSHTEALLQEHACMAEQLQSQLEESRAKIDDLEHCTQRVHDQLSTAINDREVSKLKLSEERKQHKLLLRKYDSMRSSLEQVQVSHTCIWFGRMFVMQSSMPDFQ